MKLISFSVKNYRSITKTEKIPLSNLTILVGPNNEGKSNILNALMLGSQILSRNGRLTKNLRNSRFRHRYYYENNRSMSYQWERDYPLNLQNSSRIGTTDLSFEIKLTDDEVSEFKTEVGSNINGILPLKISISKEESITFKILKSGRGSKTLDTKRSKIIDFISNKICFYYIPAIRPTDIIIEQINEMILENLEELYKNDEYLTYIEKIKKMQQPVFDRVSSEIKKSLQDFVPQVKDIKIDVYSEIDNSPFLRRSNIRIDDGTLTDIHYKGDGIQSLTAISLINQATNKRNFNKNIVLMIEEPEAHLHPTAVHQLKSILINLSKKQQVIISTHSPLLVDTENIKNNVIVTKNKAKIAKDILEMRNILGVRAPDNLISSEFVILVEGESDQRIITKILKFKSRILKSAIESRKLVIINIQGANKIDYLVNLYKNLHLTKIFIILDNDDAAKKSIEKLKNEKLIEENEYKCTVQRGLKESEIEDFFDFKLYFNKFFETFGVDLNCDTFTKGKQKWSVRIKTCFENNGKQFDRDNEKKAKELFAGLIENEIELVISKRNEAFFTSLIQQIEQRLKK